MSAVSFRICDWLGAWDGAPERETTLASLRIDVATREVQVCLTEVFDSLARTVRPHINVSAYALARWLLLNWWRLRWEPSREGHEWTVAHALGAIGEGYAWPPVSISSDGEFVQIQALPESTADVAAIRYLADATLEVAAADFEAAVDAFVRQVLMRLSACEVQDSDLRELQEELAKERGTPELAGACRLQAAAGWDPGEAPAEWLREMAELRQRVGPDAIGEVAAALPNLRGGLIAVQEGIDRLRHSDTQIDLSWLRRPARGTRPELPWEKGARMAADVRRQLDQTSGPLTNDKLAECLGVTIPMQPSGRWPLHGGFRNGEAGKAKVDVPSARVENQRFHLARVMAGALLAADEDHLLAVTPAGTAMQKCERSFAQELLCPWADLDNFTDESGLGDDGIADAADHFQVSEWTVLSTLVNKQKLPRYRLPPALQ